MDKQQWVDNCAVACMQGVIQGAADSQVQCWVPPFFLMLRWQCVQNASAAALK